MGLEVNESTLSVAFSMLVTINDLIVRGWIDLLILTVTQRGFWIWFLMVEIGYCRNIEE